MIYVIICLVAFLLMVILFGAGKIRSLQARNQNLLTEIGKNSNTFREKGIEIDGLKKQIKDSEDTCNVLEKENKRLRQLC